MIEAIMQKTHTQGVIVIDEDIYQRLPTKFTVQIDIEGKYTQKQRGALHLWCDKVAKILNDAGMELVRKSLFNESFIEIPWN